MAGMAASVGLFRRNIDGADRDTVKFDKTTQDVGRNIDKLSGRLGLLVDVAATLGPALIPTAAAAVPLIAGLTNQLGFAAIAGGTTILAFHGVGDALKAVNEQAINPSTANLQKMHEAMAKLGPAGRDFVRELQSLRPELSKLQDAAQAGLFPGMTEGIQSLTTRLPQAQELISTVADTLGTLMAKAGDSLAGPEWDAFFNMLQSEARPTLMALGESIGQVTKGLADLWVAFTPLNRSFSSGMLEASRSFAQWADGLSRTQGFADFMSYLQSTGPKVAEALGAIGNAVLQLLEAAAPLGGPALAAITAFSKAVAAIADSSLGTPILAAVAAWRAYSMAVSLAEKAQSRFKMSQAGPGGTQSQILAIGGLGDAYRKVRTETEGLRKAELERSQAAVRARDAQFALVSTESKRGAVSGYAAAAREQEAAAKRVTAAERERGVAIRNTAVAAGKGAALIGGLAVATTGAADKIGLTNTASLALMGTMAGPWGTAIGAGAGAVIDLTKANDGLNDSLTKLGAMAGQVDFATFNDKISKTQKQIDDLKHVTSVGDWFHDTAKVLGGALLGHTVNSQIADKQGKLNAAEAVNDNAMRTRGAALANGQMAASSELAAHGFQMTAAGARDAAGGLAAFTAAAKRANAAISRQGTFDAYRSALLDFNDALKTNGRTLDRNTKAGLANRESLRTIASTAIAASENIKDIGAKSEYLQRARKNFISAATAAGATRAEASRLASALGLVDRIHAKPTIQEKGADESRGRVAKMRAEIERLKSKAVKIDENGAAAARARIAALQAAINMLHGRTVTNTINIITHRSGYTPTGSADGSTVPKTGMPYADRHPYLLADGEEVISNRYGQADRHRSLLKQINANMLADGGTVQHLADGGTADRRRRRNAGNGDNNAHHVNRFAEALKKATTSLEKEKKARDDLISKRNDLHSAVAGNFLSDPFAAPTNVWAKGGGGGPLGILKTDIAKANTFKSTLAALRKQGLSGQALAAVASSGDVTQAQMLLHTGQAKQFTSLFNQRAAAANAVGSYAGNAVYGAAIARDTAQLKTLNHEVQALRKQIAHQHKVSQKNNKHNAHESGHAAGHAVSHAAAAGHKKSRRG